MTPAKINEIAMLINWKTNVEAELAKLTQPKDWSVKERGIWARAKQRLVVCVKREQDTVAQDPSDPFYLTEVADKFPEEILEEWLKGELSKVVLKLIIMGVEL